MNHEELIERVKESSHDSKGKPLKQEDVESVVNATLSALNEPTADVSSLLPSLRRRDPLP